MSAYHSSTNGIYRRRWHHEVYRQRSIQPKEHVFPFNDQNHATYCLKTSQVYQSGFKSVESYQSRFKTLQVGCR